MICVGDTSPKKGDIHQIMQYSILSNTIEVSSYLVLHYYIMIGLRI